MGLSLSAGLSALLFPEACIFCGCMLPPGKNLYICPDCHRTLPFRKDYASPACSQPEELSQCNGFICPLLYTAKVREAVTDLKFSEKRYVSLPFARLISDMILRKSLEKRLDVLVPVPLHSARFKQRGYNQAEDITSHISQSIHVPMNNSALVRQINTLPQSSLTRSQRLLSGKDVFSVAQPDAFVGKTVLLVDDVLTTGATLEQCAKKIRASGAVAVYYATAASGKP